MDITNELLGMGFKYMCMEMITVPEKSEFYLTEGDLKRLLKEYNKLAEYYLNQIKEGK